MTEQQTLAWWIDRLHEVSSARIWGSVEPDAVSLRALLDVIADLCATIRTGDAVPGRAEDIRVEVTPDGLRAHPITDARTEPWPHAVRALLDALVSPSMAGEPDSYRLPPRPRGVRQVMATLKRQPVSVAPPDVAAALRACRVKPGPKAAGEQLRKALDFVAEARRCIHRAEELAVEASERRSEARRILDEVTVRESKRRSEAQREGRMLGPIAPDEGQPSRVDAWSAERSAQNLMLREQAARAAAERALHTARAFADIPLIHHALAEVIVGPRLADAEAREDAHGIELARIDIRALAKRCVGRVARRLRQEIDGPAFFSLATDPPGCTVVLTPMGAGPDRRIRPEATAARTLTSPRGGPLSTPFHRHRLEPGDYLMRLIPPDESNHTTLELPIRLRRGEEWQQVPPGAREPEPLALPPVGALDADDCYVPAGWCTLGGDPLAVQPMPRRRLWVPGFVMRRHPVTRGEYCDFLKAIDDPARFEQCLPKPSNMGNYPLWQFRQLGVTPREVVAIDSDKPVTMVPLAAAWQYAAWYDEQRGQPRGTWRLPHEFEWEKAARGVDGRRYPWGHHFDPAWCNVASGILPGGPQPTPVRQAEEDDRRIVFAEDISPYGVWGMGGNVADWCGNAYFSEPPEDGQAIPSPARCIGDMRLPEPSEDEADLPEDPSRWVIARGGAFSQSQRGARVAGRPDIPWDQEAIILGFRLARSWPVC